MLLLELTPPAHDHTHFNVHVTEQGGSYFLIRGSSSGRCSATAVDGSLPRPALQCFFEEHWLGVEQATTLSLAP